MRYLKLLLILAALVVAACAGQTPFQHISSRMDILKDNMLSDALVADATVTLQDVESWRGKITETEYMSAKSCSEFIIAAHPEKVKIIEKMQALILSADAGIVGLAGGGSPMLIRRLTAAKYAPQGMPGAAIEPQLKELESQAIKLISGARNACLPLMNDEFLIKMAMKMFGGGL